MPAIEEMNLDEIKAVIQKARARQRELKQTSKSAERKITTLVRRRERLLQHVREIDEQIEALRRESNLVSIAAPRRRGRRPKAQIVEA